MCYTKEKRFFTKEQQNVRVMEKNLRITDFSRNIIYFQTDFTFSFFLHEDKTICNVQYEGKVEIVLVHQ